MGLTMFNDAKAAVSMERWMVCSVGSGTKLNQIQKEEELKELAQLNVDPNVRSKKGSCQ